MTLMRFPMNHHLVVLSQKPSIELKNTAQNPCKYGAHTKKAKKKIFPQTI